MDTSVERLEGNEVRLEVTVSAEQVDQHIHQAYKRLSERLNVPGFRKGHVPERVIDNMVGRDSVLADAQETIVTESYPQALDAESLRPIDEPELGVLDLPVEGVAYTYEVQVPVRPEFTLRDYSGIEVSAPAGEATEEDVEQQIDAMRDRLATLEPVEDGGIEPDSFAVLSWTVDVLGDPVPDSEVDEYVYEFGKDQMPEEFEEGLRGAVAGEDRDVSFTISESSSVPEYVGQEAVFHVHVHEVKRKILPDIDDEFALAAGGYDDVDHMYAAVKAKVQTSKEQQRRRHVEIEARRALATHLEGEMPEKLIERRTNDMMKDFMHGMDARGLTPEQYYAQSGTTPELVQQQLENEALESLRTELALEALFRDQEMDYTDDDIDVELEQMVGPERAETMRQRLEATGSLAPIREQVMQRKATEWLLEHITVNEEEPSDEPDEPDEPEEAEVSDEAEEAAATDEPEEAAAVEDDEDAEGSEDR